MIIFKTIVVTLFGQNFRVNYYSDEELQQKIGGEKFDPMCYRLIYGKIGGLL